MPFNSSTKQADAPSQAHLQGTQSQHTKANLAKEPALCQRTAHTPQRTEFLSASTKYISKLQDSTPKPTHHPTKQTIDF
jgi:hypothetical protein